MSLERQALFTNMNCRRSNMSAHAMSMSQSSVRPIILRTRGHCHGAITRLVSPGDVGELIKPFVFLDYFEGEPADAPKFGFHPHSGIATLTLILSGQVTYRESTGREGVIDTGGIEWMRASSGVWHTGGVHGDKRIKGFQLWVAMPPALELAEPQSQYLTPSDFPSVGPARVIAGEHGGVKSILGSPDGMTYLDVNLKAGERWSYTPAAGHTVLWIVPHTGQLAMPQSIMAGELAVFEQSNRSVEFAAISDSGFVLGSAVKHPHQLVTGYYSVHTSQAALGEGEKNIAAIGKRLHNQGVL
jgi:redox-sensitive bicupin YhaK (pirin superfamily)